MITPGSHYIELLQSNWSLLQTSMDTLLLSVEKAKAIKTKKEYSFEELERFDSLSAKFSRSADFFQQKILRAVMDLLREDRLAMIDMLNRAEKLEIIASADEMLEIREVRNQIAHEYIPQAIQQMIPDIIELTSSLKRNIEACKLFLGKKSWLLEKD